MRFKHVNVRVLLSSLLAVLALSAVVASAAQASAEGPFLKDGTARLLEGKSVEVKAVGGSGTHTLALPQLGITVTCSSQKLVSGAKLTGSTGANFSGGEATLEFSGCSVSGDGTSCTISEGKIKTEPLKLELAYMDSTRTGHIAVVLKPVAEESFATVKSKNCKIELGTLEGSLVDEVEVGYSLVNVGSEPAATKTLELTSPAVTVNDVWLEKAGSLTKTRVRVLETAGSEFKEEGTVELELAGGAEWGVFT
jgi:hypothetical protein